MNRDLVFRVMRMSAMPLMTGRTWRHSVRHSGGLSRVNEAVKITRVSRLGVLFTLEAQMNDI